jgi:hypothetical protein
MTTKLPVYTVSIEDKVRATRIAAARDAITRGERFEGLFPSSTGAPVVRNMREALQNLLVEIERKPGAHTK